MNPNYPLVANRAGYRCEYCRAPEQVFNFAFNVDHIKPLATKGDNSPENLALACESCNLFKSDAVEGMDELDDSLVRLFNPREDNWLEHFEFNSETSQVHGISATGRATVSRLRLNSDFHIRARKHWGKIGLYP